MNFKATLRQAVMGWKGDLPPDLLPRVQPQSHIRRCIHQIFFSDRRVALPPELERNVDHIRRLNPDWEYRLYGAEDMVAFIRDHYDERVLQYLECINPVFGAARADLFRYLLLYQSGGVYLDVKSSLRRPLNEVLRADDCYLLSRWRNKPGEEFEGWGLHPEIGDTDGEFQQWHIVAAAGHPFLRAAIERVLRNLRRYSPVLHGQGWIGVIRGTGPIAYTLAIRPLLQSHPHRIVDAQAELGFQYSIYSGAVRSPHQSLFRAHYTQLDEPLVRQTAADKAFNWTLRGAKAVTARLGIRA
jgi:inositol phosphorylceramide mannosyltransferase catalytic subunit